MNIPLHFGDFEVIFAVMSISLVITAMFVDPYYGKIALKIRKKKITNSLVAIVVLFMLTLMIRVFDQVIFR